MGLIRYAYFCPNSAALEKERLEISEVKSSIEDFEAQKENLTSNRNRLQKEIEEMRKKIQKRRECEFILESFLLLTV